MQSWRFARLGSSHAPPAQRRGAFKKVSERSRTRPPYNWKCRCLWEHTQVQIPVQVLPWPTTMPTMVYFYAPDRFPPQTHQSRATLWSARLSALGWSVGCLMDPGPTLVVRKPWETSETKLLHSQNPWKTRTPNHWFTEERSPIFECCAGLRGVSLVCCKNEELKWTPQV